MFYCTDGIASKYYFVFYEFIGNIYLEDRCSEHPVELHVGHAGSDELLLRDLVVAVLVTNNTIHHFISPWSPCPSW